MNTYNCWCKKCPGKGDFQIEAEDLPTTIICPECGSEETKVLGQVNGVFGKFASMTPKEKQTMLKKRSNEHFKTHIKEKKEYLDRAALGQTK